MRRTEASPVLQYVRGLVVAEEVRRSKDRDLLARFRSERDEEAFAALVQRHGPMVLAVCRRFAQHGGGRRGLLPGDVSGAQP